MVRERGERGRKRRGERRRREGGQEMREREAGGEGNGG